MTAMSLKIKTKIIQILFIFFPRVPERWHKYTPLRSFPLDVKCVSFPKFKLTVILERRNAPLHFQICALGLYSEFRIFWIYLCSISDNIYLQELFIALITLLLIFPILAYKTMLLASITYSHLVSHVGLYFRTVVILIINPHILFSLNLSFSRMADQNYVCQFKSTLGGSCRGTLERLLYSRKIHFACPSVIPVIILT